MQTILFFDLDATLIENRFSRKAVGPLLREIAETSDESIDDVLTVFRDENTSRQLQDPDNILTMDWADIIQTVAVQFGVTLSDDLDQRWRHFAHIDDVEILDTAPQVLKSLRAHHRKIVLATKGLMKYQMPVLEVTNMLDLFDDILTPDKTGFLKTSPQYFDKYSEFDALKIQIGDHYYDDVICAKGNGFYSVMRLPLDALSDYSPFERPQKLRDLREEIMTYPDEHTDIVPDAVVISLTELPDVIQQIEENTKA